MEDDQRSDESSDGVGPMPAPPPDVRGTAKRRKVIRNASVYTDVLPKAEMYEKSFMHRDTVCFVVGSDVTDFLVTGSVDGRIKFWKKQSEGLEFVKLYTAHLGSLTGMAMSQDGRNLATIGDDKTLKWFNVIAFDMCAIIALDFKPLCVEFIHEKGSLPLVACSATEGPQVHILAPECDGGRPIRTLELHVHPVHAIKYNPVFHVCWSADRSGALNVWDPTTLLLPVIKRRPGEFLPCIKFSMKSDTSLFELEKSKTFAVSLSVSGDGRKMCAICEDGRLRIFHFATGKMMRAYDESLDMMTAAQSDPKQSPLHLDRFDFGKRSAVEKEIRKSPALFFQRAVFDESGNFLLYPSMVGIKVFNIVENKLVRILGKIEQSERFLGITLFHGTDPTAIVTAYGRPRFYCFSHREPPESTADFGRDVFNEKPSKEDAALASSMVTENPLGKQATIHTTMGDIVVKLFFEECPKTIENFTVHSKNGYYDNTIFHRVIRDFMVQTGDPQGDGTGGESIWGGEFEDEFSRALKHDRPYTLSMANAGPNTNGSQFFVTTVSCPWLDGKHTVFGRVLQGMDVVQNIEKTPCNADDRPLVDIKILAIKVVV